MKLASALRGSVAAIALAGFLIQGCAAPSGYTISSDDPCASNRQELKAIEDYFVQSVVQGAVAGAVVGGLAGALIGGDAKSALIGAGAGAVAGGLGGYFTAKQKASGDKTQLVSSVYGDVVQENQQIDKTTATFRRLSQCRFAAAQAIKTNFQGGRISRDEAAKQLERQRNWFNEDVQFAENLGGKMGERGKEYEFASTEMLKEDPNAQRTLSLRKTQSAQAAQAAAVTQGPNATINAAANLRERPAENARRVGALTKGDKVGLVGPTTGAWTQVQTTTGLTGYVITRALSDDAGRPLAGRPAQVARPAPAPAPAPRPAADTPPPNDVAGVAQLTESNQVKRKAFSDQLTEAKVAANTSFDLDAKISGAPIPATAG